MMPKISFYKHKHMLQSCLLVSTVVITACQSVNLSTNPVVSKQLGVSSFSQDMESVAAIRTNLAGQYIKSNQLDAAMQQIQLALQADTKYAPAYDMMGILLQTEGSPANLQQAEAYFKKAIELDASFMRARNNYGVYLFKMARYTQAVEQLKVAATALGYNGRISALENLGRTYLKLGNTELAKQTFIKVLNNNSHSVIAYVELVDILVAENNIKQAQQLYNKQKQLADVQPLPARVLRQGIILATKRQDVATQQFLSKQLLYHYPDSDEAKYLNTWLKNPEAPWK